jgi:hypothetical protein
MKLFHVSERQGIELFEPRLPPSPGSNISTPVVWAVDEAHLGNYLLPRECPRVTFYATEETTQDDQLNFIGATASAHVVAIESAWLERARTTELCMYEFSEKSFVCADRTAGYFVSHAPVIPESCRLVTHPLKFLAELGYELRTLPNILSLADQVASSSLAFSCIRMRNAVA